MVDAPLTNDPLGGFGAELERHDRDRYLATLYAPAPHRGNLAAVLAFGLDLARLRDTVSQPLLARIRLQWWRESLDEVMAGTAPRRHPILVALAPLLVSGRVPRSPLDRMIDAREHDWDEAPPPDLASLTNYAADTSGALAEVRVKLLGADREADAEAARLVGTAWTLTGLLRALPFNASRGRITIPDDIAQRCELDIADLKDSRALRRAVAMLADHARGLLSQARERRRLVSRQALPVLAEARVASAYLVRLARLSHDAFNTGVIEPDPLAAWRLGFARLTGRY
ncbi:MAG TPA: squalene/phytoene synthase family protein [Stellaceae bacterium]|jgi:phytoene synthase|nr:squalene/phytoene synthase family protein [Stellaceae bacterium]